MKKLTLCISVLFMLIGLSSLNATGSFAGGDGTSTDPWQISNFAELQHFSDYASGKQEYFALTANIDATASKDVVGGYPQIANFIGNLDGNSFEIDNFHSTKSFIDLMSNKDLTITIGTDAVDIKNLGFTNVEIVSTLTNTGTIVSSLEKGALLENCFATGTVVGTTNTGGLAGRANSSAVIKNCYFYGSVTQSGGVITKGNLGGILGQCNGKTTITNCFFSGTSARHIGKTNAANIESGCYYSSEGIYRANVTDGIASTALDATDMADVTKYDGWDFITVWEIVDGMPSLQKPKVKVYTDDTYYVSNDGNDANPGTEAAPFKTLTKAMSIINYGDTCCVFGGVYRETVNVIVGSICIKAYNDEPVVITGCDVVDNWELVEGNQYKAYVSKPVSQFFHDGARANIATYPNIGADYHIMDNWHASVSDKPDTSSFVTITGEDFAVDYWKGGHYVGLNSSHNEGTSNPFRAARGAISSSFEDTIFLTNDNVIKKQALASTGGIGNGFIINHKNALDVADEWYYENDTVCFITDGSLPSVCEARTRAYVIEMEGVDSVSLLGLNIKAGSINMKDATNCIIDSCSVRYIVPFSAYGKNDWESEIDGSKGVYVSGANNTITNSYFGASWTACVTLDGENQTIDNCLLENGNWAGSRLALISVHGDSCVITNNTLRHSTRDGIEAGNGAWLKKIGVALTIEHNLIYSTNTRHTDGGCFYANHQQNNVTLIANTVLSHNWMKVNSEKYNVKKRKYTGPFYPDNYSSGYTAKHNVIIDSYAGIKSNAFDQPSTDNYFYNNTMDGLKYAGDGTGYESFQELSNNLSNVAVEPIAEYESNPILLRNNITYNDTDDEFIVGDYWDFRTKATSMAVDAAVVIDGVTPSSSPDAGCYEYGVPAWIAGCDFDIPTFDDEPSYAAPLEVPVLLSAILSQDKQYVTILWDDNSSSVQAVGIERKESNGDWMRVGTVLSGTEIYVDNYLLSDEDALYRLRNIDNDDISAPSNSMKVVLDIPTGIEGNDCNRVLSSGCSIHPNPASSYFIVSTTEVVIVSVIDLSGNTVIAPTVVNESQTISVKSLSSGLYFVKAGTELTKLIVE